MPTQQGETVRTLTYFSEKVEIRASGIEGKGLYSRQQIQTGEIVVVKGGHIMTRQERDEIAKELGPAEIQIANDLFIGPAKMEDREGSMMYLNHSCDPNLAISGQIVFIALRMIETGEELSFDYATGDNDDWEMDCQCGATSCRGSVTGFDWKREDVQARYAGHFSTYLQEQIERL